VGGSAYSGQQGSRNTVIGYNAGFNNFNGIDNTFIGDNAGFGNTTGNGNVYIGSFASGSSGGTANNEIVIGSNAVGLGSNTAVIGATTQTSATIYGRLNALGGISASGGTFSGNINLQNAEFIQNSTNGRFDFMPAPAGSTHFGLYVDTTSWGFGVVLGTVRSSDNAINTNGNFRFDVPLVVGNNVNFAFGSDSQYRIARTSIGLDTLQSGMFCDGVNNSGAFALVALADQGISTRSPATAHTTPNFYIYANSSIRNNANDFIRFEHNTINGRIVSGGTSGISIEPGSGVVGISGGISVSGITFQDGTFKNTAIPHMVLFNAGII
jgi:hypothetical protein